MAGEKAGSLDKTGLALVLGTMTFWGLAPVYFHQLSDVPPLEFLAHRAIWTAITLCLIVGLQGRFAEVTTLMRSRQAPKVALAALLVVINWGTFIWALQSGHALDASLGYYICPLMVVLLAVFFRGERLGTAQWLAIALAASGVIVLTAGLGVPPVVALGVSSSFAAYSLLKSGMKAPGEVTVACESLFLMPVAVAYLAYVHLGSAAGGYFGTSLWTTFLLAISGLITGLPLITFSMGSQRLPLAITGMAQYINPTLQALLAITLFGEGLTIWHAPAFLLIWTGLAIFTTAVIRKDRAAG